jgi:hypothetical protein
VHEHFWTVPHRASGERVIKRSILLREPSPLNDLAEGLPRKQVLFYDALSQSFEIIERTYRGLQATLAEHALGTETSQRATMGDALIASWGMVDALHRVGRLLARTPGLKQGPAVTSIRKAIVPVEDLRHEMQHLDEHIDAIAETPMPVWGCLTWATVVDENTVASSVLMPGHITEGTFQLINPAGRRVEPPVDLVTLSAAGKQVDLSELHRATAAFAERFERGAATAWEQRGNTPADQVVRVEVPL